MASLRTILWAVNALLLAALAYALSVVVADGLQRGFVANTTAAPTRTNNGAAREKLDKPRPLASFQAILDTNMFHARRSGPTVAAAATLPVTTEAGGPVTPAAQLPINLSLTGTFIFDRGALAFVIGPDGRTERVYRVKECLPRDDDTPVLECQANQGKLDTVASDHIVVTMNGGRYVVKLGAKNTSPTPTARKSPGRNFRRKNKGRPTASVNRTKKNAPLAKRAFPSTREGNNIAMRVPSAEVEKAFENFAGLVNQARVVPYIVDGTPQGFQIRKITPGSLFEQLGLNNSDVIKSVNGESLTTADQALRLFSLFRNEREVELEIERDNQPVNLSYTIE